MKFLRYALFFILFIQSTPSVSQCLTPVNFQLQKSQPMANPLFNHNLTARRDSSPAKPYLYIAAKAQGLITYNISNLTSPVFSNSIAVSALNGLDVNSITQRGSYLFLALGDIFNKNAQNSGLAIVNVSNPASPTVTSVYSFSLTSGSGHVALEGNYAYVSAMQNGILVFDVSNTSGIQLVSQFIPTVHFPKPNPSTSEKDKINARSIVAKNNILYLCYDAGGVRIINATNKTSLKETGKYSNPLLLNRPRAMNNLILNDSLVYVTADYCGMEILKIKDTSNITQVGWWNPWKCENTANNWFNSPGHTNEIEYDANCRMVFMSAGKTDMLAVSVNNPALPDSCSQYGSKTDSAGTWGLGKYQNQIYLAYVSTWPLFIPFHSEWSGLKIITYNNNCSAGINDLQFRELISAYPNPAKNEITVVNPFSSDAELEIFDASGKQVLNRICTTGENSILINIGNLQDGIYCLRMSSGSQYYNSKFVVNKN